jgi:hypothetical protein
MRKDLLKACEVEFFMRYPSGFDDPEMEIIKKKHKIEKMHNFAVEKFDEERFGFVEEVIENMIKIISRSSLVSLYEKPKFRDFARSLSKDEKETLVNGLREFLHGERSKGFEMMLDILSRGKMAKWSLISIIPYYYHPQTEVFCKPTTVKNIVTIFELEGLVYKPRPSFDFYENYKKQLLEMRSLVNPNLAPDNAAFSGFLMMVMESYK